MWNQIQDQLLKAGKALTVNPFARSINRVLNREFEFRVVERKRNSEKKQPVHWELTVKTIFNRV